MKQLAYSIIYQNQINYFLRNFSKLFKAILSRGFWIPPSGNMKLDLKESGELNIQTNQTCIVTHLLFWEGYLNFEFTPIFMEMVKKMDVFLDIGANIGKYALLSNKIFESKCIIHSFEPTAFAYGLLKKKTSTLQNIKTYNLGLGETIKTVEIYYDLPGSVQSSIVDIC